MRTAVHFQWRWRGNMSLTCGCVRVWGSDMNKKEGEETDGQRGCCKGSCHCQLDAHTGIGAMLHFTDKDGACLLCSYRNYLPHILLPLLSPWPEKLNRLNCTTVLLIHKWPTTKVFIVISYCKNLRGQKKTPQKHKMCCSSKAVQTNSHSSNAASVPTLQYARTFVLTSKATPHFWWG